MQVPFRGQGLCEPAQARRQVCSTGTCGIADAQRGRARQVLNGLLWPLPRPPPSALGSHAVGETRAWAFRYYSLVASATQTE
jgi:hypothetical protein